LPYLKWFFKDEKDDMKRKSILIFRFILLVISFLLTYATSNLSVIFDLGGGLFCPLLSYIFPVLWARWYEKKIRSETKRTLMTNAMDWSTLIFGIIVCVFANYYGFKEAMSPSKK
jgi:amino acid permease